MKQAIEAYNSVSASEEFRELERMRSKADNDMAQALRYERLEESKKWQAIVADKDAALAQQAALIAELQAQLQKAE